MKGLGYKNEKILSYGVDALVLTTVLLLTWLLFGYPHVFPYFQELSEADAIINPQEYVQVAGEINDRFDRVLLEIFFAWFVYETVCLIIWQTTLGRRIFRKKVVCQVGPEKGAGAVVVRCLIFPARTAVKLLCFYLMIPIVLAGAWYLFSKKDITLMDRIFLTRTVSMDG